MEWMGRETRTFRIRRVLKMELVHAADYDERLQLIKIETI